MQAPITATRQQEIQGVIDAVLEQLGPDVVYIRYNFGEDWSGDPAVYFRVVLSDEATEEGRFRPTTRRVSEIIDNRMDSLNMGVFVYINFRSRSEQETMKTPAWA